MMSNYDNNNKGALFRNDRRQKDTQPTHTGSINIEGVDYWLSAWVKEGKSGKFFSLSVKRKDEQQSSQSSGPAADDFEDLDIPF